MLGYLVVMKILMFFIDMLGPEYMYLGNNKNPKCSMDEYLMKLGGTFFCNCFTPAPDTPRSSACMWSGQYPKENGCNNRLKYPGRYLKVDKNLWNHLESEGYRINTYVRKSMNDIGLLPYPYEKSTAVGNVYESLNEFEITDKSVTFFYLQDLHLMMDKNGYNKKVFQDGTKVVTNMVEKIINHFGKDSFDYIVFFSDHGFRTEKKRHLIDRDRIRTLMFVHHCGDKEISFDDKLRSNVDLYPSVLEMAGVSSNPQIVGKSLFSEGHKYVVVEDHEDFSARLGQTIEHWAIVRNDGIHWLECSDQWEHETASTVFDEDYYRSVLIENADNYEENHKMWDILNGYKNMKNDSDYFSDMTTIPIKFSNKKIPQRVRRIIGRIIKH